MAYRLNSIGNIGAVMSTIYTHYIRDNYGTAVKSLYGGAAIFFKSYSPVPPAPLYHPIQSRVYCTSIYTIYGTPFCFNPIPDTYVSSSALLTQTAPPIDITAAMKLLIPPAPTQETLTPNSVPSAETPARVETPAPPAESTTFAPPAESTTFAPPAETPALIPSAQESAATEEAMRNPKDDDKKKAMLIGGIAAAVVIAGVVVYSVTRKKA